ncbi:50S ribosomal protein L10, partial [bacterium]|nr:50S ribosomal protein L10 [bacterium]
MYISAISVLTKRQKEQLVEEEIKRLQESETVLLTDFTGLPVSEANTLRKSLKEIGASYKVVKKRLLKLVFKGGKIDIDPKEIEGQIGVVFSPKDLTETSQTVYRFGKENEENFKILG